MDNDKWNGVGPGEPPHFIMESLFDDDEETNMAQHLIEPETQDAEVDREIATDLHHQIDKGVRSQLICDATPGPYRNAMMSALSGRWDDLAKDVRRGTLSKAQAYMLIRTITDARLINDYASSVIRERIESTDVETCATCQSWNDGKCPELKRATCGHFGCNIWRQRNPIVGWTEG